MTSTLAYYAIILSSSVKTLLYKHKASGCCNNTEHNDTLHNDTRHSIKLRDMPVLPGITIYSVMLTVDCHYAKCYYTECHNDSYCHACCDSSAASLSGLPPHPKSDKHTSLLCNCIKQLYCTGTMLYAQSYLKGSYALSHSVASHYTECSNA